IVATTGPKDAKIEKIARELTQEHIDKKLFTVDVWAWDDIVDRLRQFPSVGRLYYPGLFDDPDNLIKKTTDAILIGQSELKESVTSLFQSISTTSHVHPANISLDSELREVVLTSEHQAELDIAREMINEHHYRQALSYLETLRARLWYG